MHNATTDYSYVKLELMMDFLPTFLRDYFEGMEYHPWIFSALASMLIGLSGILPLLIIPDYDPNKARDGDGVGESGPVSLKTALSFAVGGMLGDVFLHLLPETWGAHRESGHVSMRCGLWVLFGMLVFIIVEKLFAGNGEENADDEASPVFNEDLDQSLSAKNLEIEDLYNVIEKESGKRTRSGLSVSEGSALPDCNGDTQLSSGCLFNSSLDGGGLCSQNTCNGILADGVSKGRCLMGNRWMGRSILRDHKPSLKLNNNNNATDKPETTTPAKNKQVSGYLNLMANSIDNFTHGLAVGGSFIVSLRVGLLTTFAILVHEIPHEVGDFAILLNSGFSRWEAAKAQLATASAGLVGAMTAVIFSGAKNAIEAKTSWIVPFTAGGFLHIALVTVLPDLLSEPDPRQAVKQLAALLTGAAIMGAITVYVE